MEIFSQSWIFVLLTVVCLSSMDASSSLNIPGTCVFEGREYADQQVFHPESCKVCTCYGGVPVCETVQCLDPKCDFAKGEILIIHANECCPVCIKKPNNCLHEGHPVQHNTVWNPGICTKCHCYDGDVICSEEKCPQKFCPKGQVFQNIPGTCCPSCISFGRSCTHFGNTYIDGESWQPSNCTLCSCNNGQVQCYVADCIPSICKENETSLLPEGGCCPICVGMTCREGDKVYQNGEEWQKDICTHCICNSGNILCHEKKCDSVVCYEGENEIMKPGECCPTCGSITGSCHLQNGLKVNGEIWQENDCMFCSCNNEDIQCHSVECDQIICPEGHISVHLPGKCCSECIPDQSVCFDKEGTRKSGETWQAGPCYVCRCVNGETICFKEECNSCAQGLVAVEIDGHCCPQCVPVQCHPSCHECNPLDPNKCTECADSQQFLQDNICVTHCSSGYFLHHGVCSKCHSSCVSCTGPSDVHCTECPSGLLLQDGKCLLQCESGYFQERKECRACHSTCLECFGPDPEHCLRCADKFLVLQGGHCLNHCSPKHYLTNERHCKACDPSCLACLQDGPLCLSCYQGEYLQDGKCNEYCKSGFYHTSSGVCLACHSTCAKCNGPSAFHCKSCRKGWFLLDGRCLESGCFEGYYSHENICYTCHPSCRTCVGPSADQCISCVGADDSLLLESGKHYGQCLEVCPEGYYRTSVGVCEVCDPSCLTCHSPGPQSCTSCHPNFLLKDENCVTQCEAGYFAENELCHECNPACLTCYGWGSDECLSCHNTSVLQGSQCISNCAAGMYMGKDGICKPCYRTCKECQLTNSGTGSICISCKNQRHYPVKNKCVSECGNGYFHSDFGQCKKCHKTCSTCDKGGVYGCTSCPPGFVLTHLNTCSQFCFAGYYEISGVCQGCGTNCLECNVEGQCEKCRNPNMVLSFGECVSNCPDQHYRAINGTCQECAWLCNKCHGPLASDCISCMPEMLLQKGSCLSECSDGFYQDRLSCLECHNNCRTCDGPGSECTSCFPPKLLQDGQCVPNCGPGKFTDLHEYICRDCPPFCSRCSSLMMCEQCMAGHFLMFGQCVKTCGKGLIEDRRNFKCRDYSVSPKIYINNSLIAEFDGWTSLNKSFVTVEEDTNFDAEMLQIKVTSLPTNGKLLRTILGVDTEVSEGALLKLSDFQQGKIWFQHDSQQPSEGRMNFQVISGFHESRKQLVNILVLSKHPPEVVKNQPLFVNRGQQKAITLELLNVVDHDKESSALIFVLEGPLHGKLVFLKNQTEVKKFSNDDIKEKSIYYIHDGSFTQNDIIVMQASDGFNIKNFVFHIQIIGKGSVTPTVLRNTGLKFKKGEMVPITTEHLQATSTQSSDDDLTFILKPPTNNPKYGILMMVVPRPTGILEDGWTDLGDGYIARPTLKFKQLDLREGRLHYKHLTEEHKDDFFTFEIVDGKHPPNMLRDQSFNLIMEKGKDDKLLSTDSSLELTVLENMPVTLTNTHLTYSNTLFDPTELLYKLINPLPTSEGLLEHMSAPGIPITSFTQLDIENMKIIYHPPEVSPGHKEKIVTLSFIVSGPSIEDLSFQERQNLTVRVLSLRDAQPVFRERNPVLLVSQGGSVVIDNKYLSVADPDTELSQLVFSLTSGPHYGTLERTVKEMHLPIEEGDEFVYDEVIGSNFVYTHDGSNSVADELEITVTDGKLDAVILIQFRVAVLDKGGPSLDPVSLLSTEVMEGEFADIGPVHLTYHDDDSLKEEIIFVLQTNPFHGVLQLHNLLRKEIMELKSGDSFSQADVDAQRLRYSAQREIGNHAVPELISFSVIDGAGNELSDQVFTINILPVDNQPPIVTVRKEIQVSEGGSVAITSEIISSIDIDSPVASLLVIIDKQPIYGHLENLKNVGTIASFPIQDIMQNTVYYTNTDHLQKEVTEDKFLFHVTDGINSSPTLMLNISIKLINDEPPVLNIENLFVPFGGSVVVKNTSISLEDIDSSIEGLTFSVIRPPFAGHLEKRHSKSDKIGSGEVLDEGSRFSYKELLDELISYTHENPEFITDKFSISVSDGDFTDSGQVLVSFSQKDKEVPRIKINHGLEIPWGGNQRIDSSSLLAADKDSDDIHLTYVLTQHPKLGLLQLLLGSFWVDLKAESHMNSFTQQDVNLGRINYIHSKNSTGSSDSFVFNVLDSEGNGLLAQSFIITIQEDRIPPIILTNTGLSVKEGLQGKITTLQLSATDAKSESSLLKYKILVPPTEGHLELLKEPGIPVIEWLQRDLAAQQLVYIHTSNREVNSDSFIFSVSDGVNNVTRTFPISVMPVDDSLPVLSVSSLKVQEGTTKIITEFELKAVDLDTKDADILFSILESPSHGLLKKEDMGGMFKIVQSFNMEDIYNGRIVYIHDGSDTLEDEFSFLVSDTNNLQYMVEKQGELIIIDEPTIFKITISPVDNGTPIIRINTGLHYLQYHENVIRNGITKKELLTEDVDTTAEKLTYIVTVPPKLGHLELVTDPGNPVLSFKQDDINKGGLIYILTTLDYNSNSDYFVFDVRDEKPNEVKGNIFHIQWSWIGFEKNHYIINEKDGTVKIKVKRHGNLKQYSIVQCRTESGTATSNLKKSAGKLKLGKSDFVEHVGQVQFDEGENEKYCSIVINDDSIFEGPETFFVELNQPTYALLEEPKKIAIVINDTEDEPQILFGQSTFHINETEAMLFAPVLRLGDLSSSVSAICYTSPKTATGSSSDSLESGSDYKSRQRIQDSKVVFQSGITKSTCNVKIIDDSEFEGPEEFQILLADPSVNAHIGNVSVASVIINGPNDEPTIFLSSDSYTVAEHDGEIKIEIKREGSDLSKPSVAWCATRLSDPPSATPGLDYIPSSAQIVFEANQVLSFCSLTILDDAANPKMEGNETFIVFLNTVSGASLGEPSKAVITINDTGNDVPTLQFKSDEITVKELDGVAEVPIIRTGDLQYRSVINCITQQKTATVDIDFKERSDTNLSEVVFEPGETSKNCVVSIIDDPYYEKEEYFLLLLTMSNHTENSPVIIGDVSTVKVIINNKEDVPTLQFEKNVYSVLEPNSSKQIATVTIKVVRSGDNNQTSRVRISTRDGSATSGVDYHPKSKMIKFKPGETTHSFEVEVLYNKEREWHETFNIMLGPDEPINAELGKLAMTTVTILDQEASGSKVLPAIPIVVSLLKYDDMSSKDAEKPSPGYPLICVTPCDPHYPKYSEVSSLCKEAGINQSTIYYSWEIAVPLEGVHPHFELLTDDTLFASSHHQVLDSIYFGRHFLVRCIAQPFHTNGNLGIPLKSKAVTIASDNGICQTPIINGLHIGFQTQSFVATLKYTGLKDKKHPNRLHIHVEVPHQDGMLPLISTFPLHNLHYLLIEPLYRQQHICSNLMFAEELASNSSHGFLRKLNSFDSPISGPGYDRPYQFDSKIRENSTVLFYQHLNLKSCVWTFDAYYHMTELVDLCGGTVVSDFQVRDAAQSFLTVRLPLYVSYVYATAPTGWASMEHRTEMEFSFLYNTVLWRTGLEMDSILSAHLQVLRVVIGSDGRLILDFKTDAKFRGQFVMSHHTLPGFTSRIIAPEHLAISFELVLVWSSQTFDGPTQLWKATSNFNLKDYTGNYIIELIPCTVSPTQTYTVQKMMPLLCTAHKPERFTVPIAFQQTNRPVPVTYTLNTDFQLFNNKNLFALNPSDSTVDLDDIDYKGTFSKGQIIFGRVLWHPDQDLESAYKLRIERVYLCTGREGYLPAFDPTGEEYGEGAQFGCLHPHKNLKHRFLVLNRGHPEEIDKAFYNVPFEASFIGGSSEFEDLEKLPGVDGFLLKVDALYKVNSGHQWYIQVVYTIGSAHSSHRVRRMLQSSIQSSGHNGTNMRTFQLNETQLEALSQMEINSPVFIGVTALGIVLMVLFFVIAIVFVVVWKRKSSRSNAKDTCEINNKCNLQKENLLDCKKKHWKSINETTEYSQVVHKGQSSNVRIKAVPITVRNNLNDNSATEV